MVKKFFKIYHYIIYKERLFSTVGVHPTRCKVKIIIIINNKINNFVQEFVENEKNYIEELLKIIQDGLIDKKIVAVGEFGLGKLIFYLK